LIRRERETTSVVKKRSEISSRIESRSNEGQDGLLITLANIGTKI
jgi:hypothetical protein